METQILTGPGCSVITNKCTIYYKSKLSQRMWNSLRRSLSHVESCYDCTASKPATAIVFVSKTMILVI